ncbi:MATE family efflux transporter [Corynebacterium doosanense]|uniref:Multidrug transporter MatE n=1 Tax=Corynebacterium doosanense CAU 212 = DSM 45436 TaxID=558173 RepID=A0A097IGQ9_9CORY|nr:MATE family efflux transporter [Corynebacterium doosanense]AIT61331.1 multidrug transporter MatE [Corynebacterium doosanense CAU 212 = DSM 45436]
MTGEVTGRQIFALALPALGVLSATPLYLMLDTAVIGRLGAFELAALAAGAAIQSSLTTQLTFLSYGTTARSARLYGAGDRRGAVAEGVQATWLGLAVGLVLASLVWIFAGRITLALAGDEAVAQASAHWLRVAAVAIPLTLMVMAGNGWLRGIQDTRRPLYFVLAGVIPGALAIFPLVALFGLVGSAMSNVLGMAIAATAFVVCLIREHDGSWAPRPRVIWQQLILGRDLILRSLSFQVAFLSAAAVAARFGTAPLAAHQIMLQLWNFITLVLDSLAIAAQALTGAALGRGTVGVARSVGRKVTVYSLVFAGLLAAVFALGARVIPRIFTTDAAVLEAMRIPWWILLAMIVAGGVVFAIDGVLLGAGDAAFLRTISIGSVLLGFLPGVWISYALDGGLPGVWLGLLAFVAIRLVAVIWRFHSMRWAVTGGGKESER